MVNFPSGKIYNSYLIETSDYESTKKDILNLAVNNGFERTLVYAGSHPDIIFLECIDEKIKAANIKDIIENSFYSPNISDRKFYIIYDAVNLDTSEQNSLLKTLEDAPIYNSYFLVSSNTSKMLDTIKSRCLMLRDEKKDDYKKILSIEFVDEAIMMLANIKFNKDADIMTFAEKFDKREDMFHDMINIYRYILRDAMMYKKTLSKDAINVKEKEMEIISIANSLTYEELGFLVDNLDTLSYMKGYQVDKKIAIFNFMRGVNGKMFRNKI